MNNGWVKSVDEVRDLGVFMSKDLKLKTISNRGASYKSAEAISKIYRIYVRPHVEYCIQFRSPINEKDADMLEGVQRRQLK